MIAFILPVRHPANARSYARIEELLQQTVASVCNAADEDYRVIVSCSKAPEDPVPHPNVDYHVVDFPPPGAGQASEQQIESFRRDKGTKVFAGMLKARDYGADHIMIVDADDFVHRDLAGFCNSHKDANGWFVKQGLMYRDGGAVVCDLDNFSDHCGTSIILHRKLLEPFIDPSLTPNSSQDEILAKTDHEFLTMVLAAHRPVAEFFAKQGQPLEPVPFRAAVWLTGSAESHSGIHFNGLPRVVSREEIGAYHLPVTMTAATWAGVATELPAYWAKYFLKTYVLKKP